MITVELVTLEANGVRLEPMALEHAPELAQAARDGALWNLRVTSVPGPGEETAYVRSALEMRAAGSRMPFVVRELPSGKVIGSTSYHDIISDVDRVEIGYTWYAKSRQRTSVNTGVQAVAADARVRDARHARSSDFAPTTSTTRRKQRSCGWARNATESSATMRCAATARCATR